MVFSTHSLPLCSVLDADQASALPVANRLVPWCLWLACMFRSCLRVFVCVGMRQSKQCQIEMVMCCNTVPAPCASVSNQHASVKLPLSPSETLENPAYSANITTGAVFLSLSLHLYLSLSPSLVSLCSLCNNTCMCLGEVPVFECSALRSQRIRSG